MERFPCLTSAKATTLPGLNYARAAQGRTEAKNVDKRRQRHGDGHLRGSMELSGSVDNRRRERT
jgi:hypothetical protein